MNWKCTDCSWQGTNDELRLKTYPNGGDDTLCPKCGGGVEEIEDIKLSTIKAYKCKECNHIEPTETMNGTITYTEFDGDVFKDWEPICPKCNAEGDDYFELIEE